MLVPVCPCCSVSVHNETQLAHFHHSGSPILSSLPNILILSPSWAWCMIWKDKFLSLQIMRSTCAPLQSGCMIRKIRFCLFEMRAHPEGVSSLGASPRNTRFCLSRACANLPRSSWREFDLFINPNLVNFHFFSFWCLPGSSASFQKTRFYLLERCTDPYGPVSIGN